MKNTRLSIIVIITSTLLLQSCFEIRETVRLRNNGSGSFSIAVDLSNVRHMMESFAGTDNPAESSPYKNMEKQFSITSKKLEGVNGISNIQLHSQKGGYLVMSSFDFASIEALNAGMNIVYENDDDAAEAPDYYKLGRRKFERTTAHNFMDLVKSELNSGQAKTGGMDLSLLFSDVVYVNKIIFDDKTVRKVRAGYADISDNGSAIVNRYYIFRDDKEQSLEFKVRVR